MPKTTLLNNRKILTDDYNVFRRGVQETFGSVYGHINEHIGKALRHYGQHLIDNDHDHIEAINTKSRPNIKSRPNTTQSTPLFGTGGITEEGNDRDPQHRRVSKDSKK